MEVTGGEQKLLVPVDVGELIRHLQSDEICYRPIEFGNTYSNV